MKTFITALLCVISTTVLFDTAKACDNCQPEVSVTENNCIRIRAGSYAVTSLALPQTVTVTNYTYRTVPAYGVITRTSRSGHACGIRCNGTMSYWVSPGLTMFEEDADVRFYNVDVHLSNGQHVPCGVLVVDGIVVPAIDPPPSKIDWSK